MITCFETRSLHCIIVSLNKRQASKHPTSNVRRHTELTLLLLQLYIPSRVASASASKPNLNERTIFFLVEDDPDSERTNEHRTNEHRTNARTNIEHRTTALSAAAISNALANLRERACIQLEVASHSNLKFERFPLTIIHHTSYIVHRASCIVHRASRSHRIPVRVCAAIIIIEPASAMWRTA